MRNIVIGLVVLAMVFTSRVSAKTADDEKAVRKVLASFDEPLKIPAKGLFDGNDAIRQHRYARSTLGYHSLGSCGHPNSIVDAHMHLRMGKFQAHANHSGAEEDTLGQQSLSTSADQLIPSNCERREYTAQPLGSA